MLALPISVSGVERPQILTRVRAGVWAMSGCKRGGNRSRCLMRIGRTGDRAANDQHVCAKRERLRRRHDALLVAHGRANRAAARPEQFERPEMRSGGEKWAHKCR